MSECFLSQRNCCQKLAGLLILACFLSACRPAATQPASDTPAPTATTAQAATQPVAVPASETAVSTTATETPFPPTATETAVLPTATPEPPTGTPAPTALPGEMVDKFGVPMILIPAGAFTMGHDNNQAVAAPAHKVYLDAFYIDKYEVTNELYLACEAAGVCTTGGGVFLHRADMPQNPVMDVTWYEAQRYCEWRSDGDWRGTLPSEAQWEKAARGTDERLFPWGNEPVTCERARYTDCGIMTVPVGQHPAGASFYGVEDMAGNAWEWVYDWYENDYYKVSPYKNPTGPERETGWKTERGGAWFYEASLQTAVWRNQAPVTAHYLYVGFRCALIPPVSNGVE